MAKVDLHLHSKASRRSGGWFTHFIGCPESYSEPLVLYRRLKEKGMNFITLTDHDTIDGVLEIAHFPEVFVSAEYTVKFPEEGVMVHVLVYGIEESIHEDLLRLRENVYDFVRYLKERGIPHSLAHPLYSINGGRLTPSLIEKFVLLFDNWEIINGTRGEKLKELEERIARSFSGWDKIRLLEEKHGMASLRERPNISFTAGSDDHGGLDAGRTYTLAYAHSKEEFLKVLKEGKTFVATEKLGYERILNTVGAVGYRFLLTKNKIPQGIKPFLDFVFEGTPSFLNDIYLKGLLGVNGNRGQLFKELVDKLPKLTLSKLNKNLSPNSVGEVILSFLLHITPLVILSAQRRDEVYAEGIAEELGFNQEKPFRLAYITDTYFDINGVAKSTQAVRKVAEEYNLPVDVLVVRPGQATGIEKDKNLRLLGPLVEFSTPFYPEFRLRVPSLLELSEALTEYSQVHISTPGPLGILSFVVAKLLHLPVTTAFHTDVPAYAYIYTKNHDLKDYLYRLLVFMHNLSEKVFVPSESYANLLKEKGVFEEKIRVFRRGVDVEHFNPRWRERDYFQRVFKVPVKGRVILYVGRVSKEKNLDLLLELAQYFPEETFIVIGDGPYRFEIEKRKGKNLFTLGYLIGEALAKAYASADLFLFPSETETYGFVVLEAMASGLPVLVSKKGALKEHVKDGVNGFLASELKEYVEKLSILLSDEGLRKRLASEALSYAKALDLKRSYLEYLCMIPPNLKRGFQWEAKEGQKDFYEEQLRIAI